MRRKPNFLQILGLALVLLSAAALLGSEFYSMRNEKTAENLADRLQTVIPALREGDPQDYSDPAMPVLQLDGQDFCGLIRGPSFGVSLPLGSSWDSSIVMRYPCRFSGSAYDNSLIVGGSADQFAFCGRLDLGETITVTDMTGARFSYQVTRIDRRPHADSSTLLQTDSDLTLFVRDDSTLDYIIVRCSFLSRGIGSK